EGLGHGGGAAAVERDDPELAAALGQATLAQSSFAQGLQRELDIGELVGGALDDDAIAGGVGFQVRSAALGVGAEHPLERVNCLVGVEDVEAYEFRAAAGLLRAQDLLRNLELDLRPGVDQD